MAIFKDNIFINQPYKDNLKNAEVYHNGVKVFPTIQFLDLPQYINTFDLRSFINSKARPGVKKFVITNRHTQPTMNTGDLTDLEVELINTGEFRGTYPSENGVNITSPLILTNYGWIRGAGGNGGAGVTGAKGRDGTRGADIPYKETLIVNSGWLQITTDLTGRLECPENVCQGVFRCTLKTGGYSIGWRYNGEGVGEEEKYTPLPTLKLLTWYGYDIYSHKTDGWKILSYNISKCSKLEGTNIWRQAYRIDSYYIPGGAGGVGGAGSVGGAGGIGQSFKTARTNGSAGQPGQPGEPGKINTYTDHNNKVWYGNPGGTGSTGVTGGTGGNGGTWGVAGQTPAGGTAGQPAGKSINGVGNLQDGSVRGSLSGAVA